MANQANVVVNDIARAIYLVDANGNPLSPTNPLTVSATLASNAAVNVAQIGGVATQMASSDGVTASNVQEVVIGLYNGTTIDRLKTAGALGDQYTTGLIGAAQFVFNGGSFDRVRTPTTFVSIAAVAVTAGTPVAVWTPTGGRKFHLMGYAVSLSVAGAIIFKDGTTEIFRTQAMLAGTGVNNPANFGNGYASSSSNQALNIDVTASGTVQGFVFGTAEF